MREIFQKAKENRRVVIYFLMIIVSSFLFLHLGFTYTQVCIRVVYSIFSFVVLGALLQVPVISRTLETVIQDRKTIYSHWMQDTDLRLLTWILRLFRMLALILFVLGVSFFPSSAALLFPEGGLLGGSLSLTELLSTSGPLCMLLGVVLWQIVETIQLVATLHVILYRNTLTQKAVFSVCIDCGTFALGTLAVAAGMVHVVSSTPYLEPSVFGNMYQTYSMTGRGFGFDSQLAHQKYVVLLACPSFQRDMALLVTQEHMLTTSAQEAWVRANEAEVIQHTTTLQRQVVGMKPSFNGIMLQSMKSALFSKK